MKLEAGTYSITPNWVFDAIYTLRSPSEIKILLELSRRENFDYKSSVMTVGELYDATQIDIRSIQTAAKALEGMGHILRGHNSYCIVGAVSNIPSSLRAAIAKFDQESSRAAQTLVQPPQASATPTQDFTDLAQTLCKTTRFEDPKITVPDEEKHPSEELEAFEEKDLSLSHSRGENFSNEPLESPKNPEAPSFSPKILEGVKSPLVSSEAKTPPQAILEPTAANQEDFLGGGAAGVDNFVENSRGGGLDCKNPQQADNSSQFLMAVFGLNLLRQMLSEPSAANVTRTDWYSLSQNRLNQLLEQAKFDAEDHGIAVQTAMKKRLDDAVKRPGERKPRRDLSGNVSGGSPYVDLESPKTPEPPVVEVDDSPPVIIPKIVNGKKVILNAASENALN